MVKLGRRIIYCDGVFFVALNSTEIQIDVVRNKTAAGITQGHIFLDQELVASIVEAPEGMLADFVIGKLLTDFPPA